MVVLTAMDPGVPGLQELTPVVLFRFRLAMSCRLPSAKVVAVVDPAPEVDQAEEVRAYWDTVVHAEAMLVGQVGVVVAQVAEVLQ